MKTLIILLICLPTFAKYFQVNNEHSMIKFEIEYMAVSDVEGRFKNFEIFYEQDLEVIKNLRGKILVKSISTDDDKRDAHLLTQDFFHESNFPYIEFKSTQPFIRSLKEVKTPLKVTIKDITKEIDAKVKFIASRVDPFTKKAGDYYEASLTINRKDFGITWNKTLDNGSLLLDDKVRISIRIEAYEVGQKPAYSRFFNPKIKKDLIENREKKSPQKINQTKPIPLKGSISPDQKVSFTMRSLIITFISGFFLFLLLIAISYYGQKYISEYLERKGFSENMTYVITNAIIMIVIILLAIVTAPFMGFGHNPLDKLLG